MPFFLLHTDKSVSNNPYLLEKIPASKMEQLKKIDGGVEVAGDGRHDSMGHSAKFCAYTMFCSTVPMIIHFDIVQV